MAQRLLWARVTIVVGGRCYLIVDRDHTWKLQEIEPTPEESMMVEVPLKDGLYAVNTNFLSFGPDNRRVLIVRTPENFEHVQRRQNDRLTLLLDGALTVTAENESCGVLVRDLSCSGAKIMASRVPETLQEGSQVRLDFYTASTGEIVVGGEVRRLMERARGFEMGIAFDNLVVDTWKQLASYITDIRHDRERRGLA